MPPRELTTGSTFARRYQVIEDLGHGGMGRVYKVFDMEVREKLALKLLNPEIASDERTIERFRNELKLARTISHRNICRMHDFGREEGTYYITMEYVQGEDLKSFIHRVGALPIGKAVHIARQICDGLAEAHRVGVVHRDLKPQNVMIDHDGNARIMDFGIARSVKGKGITGANVMIGTPEYMSPEQVDGKEADWRSDIYSLGIVLFEMLTGRLPFEGETPLSVAVKQKIEAPPDPQRINPQIPEGLSQVVRKCLDKSKDKRYQSADDLSADLAGIEAASPERTTPAPVRKPATSKQITVRLPSKRIWIPAVIVLTVVIAFIIWQFIPQSAAAKRSLAVVAFRNQTGDKAFDYLQEAIPNLLITSLELSGHFRVTSWQRLNDLLRQSGRDEKAAFDEDAAFAVCRKEGIDALVAGSYIKAGDTFATDAKVLDISTKQLLKSASSKGEGAASILKTQIDQLSRSISRGIGLSVLKIEKSQPKIIDLTTDSMEAYNYFLRGRDEQERFYNADARRSLEKAVVLDPTFADAYLYLAKAANDLSDIKARNEAMEKAKRFAGKAPEKVRLFIEAYYASWIERDPNKPIRVLKELTGKYPAEKYAHYELGVSSYNRGLDREALEAFEKTLTLDPNFGLALNAIAFVHSRMGNFDKAIRFLESYAAQNPGDSNPLDSLAEMYLRMGKLDEAAAKYKGLLAAKPDFYLSYGSLAYVYALKESYGDTNRAIADFITRAASPSAKMEGQRLKAFYGYLQGRWNESAEMYLSLKKQAEEAGIKQTVASVNRILGFIHSDRGEFEAARKAFEALVAWNMEPTASNRKFFACAQGFFNGWVDLQQGRVKAATDGLRKMQSLLPDVDLVNRDQAAFLYQLLGAEIALAENALGEAVAMAEKIVPAPLGTTRAQSLMNYNLPFLKDVLARVYWKKGDLDKAAAEYTKLMTINPANQVRLLIHPLYHYRLGRVLEQKGEKDKARLQYEKFVQYWADADAGHAELKEARARLAALRHKP
jgi:serine/threonine protein kinase/cytochrome c-type biogenesis protein CcmH/NrfG